MRCGEGVSHGILIMCDLLLASLSQVAFSVTIQQLQDCVPITVSQCCCITLI